jgi:hypothetical protein
MDYHHTKRSLSGSEWGTRKPAVSMEEGQDLEPRKIIINIVIVIIVIIIDVSCHRSILPGNSLEPTVIPIGQASSFTLQYFPYYVLCVLLLLLLLLLLLAVRYNISALTF